MHFTHRPSSSSSQCSCKRCRVPSLCVVPTRLTSFLQYGHLVQAALHLYRNSMMSEVILDSSSQQVRVLPCGCLHQIAGQLSLDGLRASGG